MMTTTATGMASETRGGNLVHGPEGDWLPKLVIAVSKKAREFGMTLALVVGGHEEDAGWVRGDEGPALLRHAAGGTERRGRVRLR